MRISKVQKFVEGKVVPVLVNEVVKPTFETLHWIYDPRLIRYREYDCPAINIYFVSLTLFGLSHKGAEVFNYILGIFDCDSSCNTGEFSPCHVVKIYVPESGKDDDINVPGLIWNGKLEWDFELEV